MWAECLLRQRTPWLASLMRYDRGREGERERGRETERERDRTHAERGTLRGNSTSEREEKRKRRKKHMEKTHCEH